MNNFKNIIYDKFTMVESASGEQWYIWIEGARSKALTASNANEAKNKARELSKKARGKRIHMERLSTGGKNNWVPSRKDFQ